MSHDDSLVEALNSHYYTGRPTAVTGWDEEYSAYINVVDPIILVVIMVYFVDDSWERQALTFNTNTHEVITHG